MGCLTPSCHVILRTGLHPCTRQYARLQTLHGPSSALSQMDDQATSLSFPAAGLRLMVRLAGLRALSAFCEDSLDRFPRVLIAQLRLLKSNRGLFQGPGVVGLWLVNHV